MEALAERSTAEQARSFDPLASIKMLRHDLVHYGRILPETREQVYDEELSYLSEGVDRASRTTFALRREADEVVYFTKGGWRSYLGMLHTSLEVAHREAAQDPRRAFLAERAVDDLQTAYRFCALKPGESLSWYSAFPEQEAKSYGVEFITSLGFNAKRRLGFLYQASCQQDGSILMKSQTIDNSDEKAFRTAMVVAGEWPEAGIDDLVVAYDGILEAKYGGEFTAGRREVSQVVDTWQEITRQRDLVAYLLDGLEIIAGLDLPSYELEQKAKEHVYGVWATFKQRLDGRVFTGEEGHEQNIIQGYNQNVIALEVRHNFIEFARSGKVLIGCGGEIRILKGEGDILGADGASVFKAIFGGDDEEDKFGSLTFKCQKGHFNTRPRNKLVEQCKTCKISVRC